ncbi:MAG: thioredoxin domain-containing protein [Deltaproteobacteria bacterium]|nr:thioredoxin domain-containing protein [Deltaproteobacteria bacterium]
MRKALLRVIGGLGGLIFLVACKPAGTGVAAPSVDGADPAVIATVNGEAISSEELNTAAEPQLKQVKTQIYQIKKNALDDLVEKKLIAAAAKQAGQSAEAYLKAKVGDTVKEPTSEEMQQLYDQKKAQLGNKSFEEMKGQIRDYLVDTRTDAAHQALLAELKKDAQIDTRLEPPRTKVEGGDNPSRGPANAPIQIVEWTDYQCPYCGSSRATLNQILATYGDKVRYTIRDFPLNFHQYAMKAHEAAHCAGDQGKYWEMNQQLFGAQRAIEVPKLKEYAKQLKLNTAKFDQCLESGKHADKVRKNMEAGMASGVTGTPSFFVNGVNLSGARPFGEFKDVIDRELTKR